MILSFKPQFVIPILQNTKVHTIREDKHNRYGNGRYIQMATGVRTKNYNCFCEAYCISTQKIYINHAREIFIDGNIISPIHIIRLALNDGFESVEDFWKWFDKPFQGKIIHWTDYKY